MYHLVTTNGYLNCNFLDVQIREAYDLSSHIRTRKWLVCWASQSFHTWPHCSPSRTTVIHILIFLHSLILFMSIRVIQHQFFSGLEQLNFWHSEKLKFFIKTSRAPHINSYISSDFWYKFLTLLLVVKLCRNLQALMKRFGLVIR